MHFIDGVAVGSIHHEKNEQQQSHGQEPATPAPAPKQAPSKRGETVTSADV